MDHETKISLSYIVRPCPRKQKIPYKNLNGLGIPFLLLLRSSHLERPGQKRLAQREVQDSPLAHDLVGIACLLQELRQEEF